MGFCPLQLSFENFLILRRIQPDVFSNVRVSSCKGSVILFRLQTNFNFLDRFSLKKRMSDFMEICPLGAELLHADRLSDGQTERTEVIIILRTFFKCAQCDAETAVLSEAEVR